MFVVVFIVIVALAAIVFSIGLKISDTIHNYKARKEAGQKYFRGRDGNIRYREDS